MTIVTLKSGWRLDLTADDMDALVPEAGQKEARACCPGKSKETDSG